MLHRRGGRRRAVEAVRRLRIEHRRQISRHFQPVINMSQHDSQPPQIVFLSVLRLSYVVLRMQRSEARNESDLVLTERT